MANNDDSNHNNDCDADFTFYNVDIRNRNTLLDIFSLEAIATCIHLAAKIMLYIQF